MAEPAGPDLIRTRDSRTNDLIEPTDPIPRPAALWANRTMSPRTKLGWIALALFAGAAAAYLPGPVAAFRPAAMPAVKVGIVAMLAWLAYPQLILLPRWTLWTILLATILIAFPVQSRFSLIRIGLIVVPLLFLLSRLAPRRKQSN